MHASDKIAIFPYLCIYPAKNLPEVPFLFSSRHHIFHKLNISFCWVSERLVTGEWTGQRTTFDLRHFASPVVCCGLRLISCRHFLILEG